MKIAIVVGWILLAVEAVFVVTMFVSPNVGDDAAGRGMARGFGLVLGPALRGRALARWPRSSSNSSWRRAGQHAFNR